MAALAYPTFNYPTGAARRRGAVRGTVAGSGGGHLRLVREAPVGGGTRLQSPFALAGQQPGSPSPRVRIGRRARAARRLLPGLATGAALVGLWVGAGALSGAGGSGRLARLPGARPVAGGYAYVVRPGDTLWSIAARLEPGADPRPLMDRLSSQLHGGALLAGSVLVVP